MNKEEFKASLLAQTFKNPGYFLELIMGSTREERRTKGFYRKDATFYASEFDLKIIINRSDEADRVNLMFEDVDCELSNQIPSDCDFSNSIFRSKDIYLESMRIESDKIIFQLERACLFFNLKNDYELLRINGGNYMHFDLNDHKFYGLALQDFKVISIFARQQEDEYIYVDFKPTPETINDLKSVDVKLLPDAIKKDLVHRFRITTSSVKKSTMILLLDKINRIYNSKDKA